MSRQRSIKQSAAVSGRGLFGGQPCTLRFQPAPVNAGITFVRTDCEPSVRIRAHVAKAARRDRRTSLVNGETTVETVEHVLAAVWGLGVDNVAIELDAPEAPSTDGSPLSFAEALQQAGIVEQDAERKVRSVTEAVSVQDGEATLAALPGGAEEYLDILYDLDYSEVPSIGRQVCAFRLGQDDFMEVLAGARTFSLEAEARQMQARGIGAHLRCSDVLVIGPKGPIDNELRMPDEPVRHKVCDLVGDLALLGVRLSGRVIASKSGHALNHTLLRQLTESMAARDHGALLAAEPVMDIRRIMRLLPHRYPFLMVDRILTLEDDKRAVGVKNVSINEPFFQGHYPDEPIMPGVLILEAMAQLSGVLLSRRLEHTGKVAVLLSMDGVKMRRPVRPGDQLVLEARTLHVRTRTGHCRCEAFVGDDVAAEAEIKFMLVDAEPE